MVLVLVGLTCLILLAIAIVHLLYIVPVYTEMMMGIGTSFSLPTRFAIGTASYGWLLLLGGAAGLIALYVRGRRGPGEREHFATALGLSAVVLAVFVGLVSWAYVDVAKAVPAHPRGAPVSADSVAR